jgi:hypothetical protein
MSHSKNSRRGSKKGNAQKGFWSRRAESKATDSRGAFAKKYTHKVERQLNKPTNDDFR